MDAVFAWKTIDAAMFNKEASFSFSELSEKENINSWNSLYEDLLVTVSISIDQPDFNLAQYLAPQEEVGIVIEWVCDRKFSGASAVSDLNLNGVSVVKCKIPKGYCATHLNISACLIVTKAVVINQGEWSRPVGSVIAKIPILEDVSFNNGSWFPIIEIEGSGKNLIHWEFANVDNFDSSVTSGLLVLVDKKHPCYAGDLGRRVDRDFFISLNILQAFARKCFSTTVYSKIVDTQDETKEPGTLAAAFQFMIDKLKNYFSDDSLESIRNIYNEAPEKIDEAVDSIFSNSLKSVPHAPADV